MTEFGRALQACGPGQNWAESGPAQRQLACSFDQVDELIKRRVVCIRISKVVLLQMFCRRESEYANAKSRSGMMRVCCQVYTLVFQEYSFEHLNDYVRKVHSRMYSLVLKAKAIGL
jgi:hypothetical protein